MYYCRQKSTDNCIVNSVASQGIDLKMHSDVKYGVSFGHTDTLKGPHCSKLSTYLHIIW